MNHGDAGSAPVLDGLPHPRQTPSPPPQSSRPCKSLARKLMHGSISCRSRLTAPSPWHDWTLPLGKRLLHPTSCTVPDPACFRTIHSARSSTSALIFMKTASRLATLKHRIRAPLTPHSRPSAPSRKPSVDFRIPTLLRGCSHDVALVHWTPYSPHVFRCRS